MEQMPICETNTFSGADEIPRVLFKRDYYYHHYHYHYYYTKSGYSPQLFISYSHKTVLCHRISRGLHCLLTSSPNYQELISEHLRI